MMFARLREQGFDRRQWVFRVRLILVRGLKRKMMSIDSTREIGYGAGRVRNHLPGDGAALCTEIFQGGLLAISISGCAKTKWGAIRGCQVPGEGLVIIRVLTQGEQGAHVAKVKPSLHNVVRNCGQRFC